MWPKFVASGKFIFLRFAGMDPLRLKVILITCVVFVPLERLFALHRKQKVFRLDWANDLFFLLLNGLVVKLPLHRCKYFNSLTDCPRIISSRNWRPAILDSNTVDCFAFRFRI